MTRKIRDVFYFVQDMERAVKFYTEALGLKAGYASKHWTSMDAGGVTFGLHWTEGAVVPAIARDEFGAHNGGTVTFASDDIAADRLRLERAGAKILGESVQPWGHSLVFEDLDGNVLKLMTSSG